MLQMAMYQQYRRSLWWTMDVLGVNESIERKILTAVTIQFVALLAVGAVPVVLSGTAQTVAVGVIIALGIIAFGNTVLIAREDFVQPITELEQRVKTIANGETDIEPIEADGNDEIASLIESFETTRQYIATVGDQADALAAKAFDDPVFEQRVPGSLGASLATMRDNLETSINDLEVSRREAEQARQEAEQLATTLEQQADVFGARMEQAADGDLTQRLPAETDQEAMTQVATSFNDMITDVETTVGSVQDRAAVVAQESQSIDEATNEIEVVTERVQDAASEIQAETDRQAERFETVFQEASDLSATIEEIAATTDDLATTSAAATDRADDASEAASDILPTIQRIEQRMEAVTERIETLDEEMEKIGDIVELIDDVADETNLLALNASVEASRAEDGAAGFAVVADEVKRLAEETADATTDVEAVINEVQESAATAVEEINDLQDEVERGTTEVKEGMDAIDDVIEHVRSIDAGIQSIDEATDEQARAGQEIVEQVEAATDGSEATATTANEVAATAQQGVAAATQASTGARTLSESARELMDSVEAFQTGGTTEQQSEDHKRQPLVSH